ncbi:dual specificity protein phosphatase 14-like [Eucyclogobius newberryi]|uniref:dual specificity protein phosphatase 14-like n=1 Tax=Eucyclogobius newberryi TaxID=166745 RepID=UPI003B5AFA42
MSVSQVSPGLFLSGLDPALKASVLTQRNIKLIVNASGVQGVRYPEIPGLVVVEIPVQDVPHAPLDQYFDLVSEKIQQNLVQNQNCLVHCTAGRSRSPALVLAFLIRFSGLSLAQSYTSVLEFRPFIRINAGFWRQLMNYELRVQNRSTVQMNRTASGVLPHIQDQDRDRGEGICING